jgi:predicted HTH transcriptional regulator
MTPITYRGFTVLMLEVENGIQPVWYKDKLFIRDGASHKEVTKGEEINSVYNLFN